MQSDDTCLPEFLYLGKSKRKNVYGSIQRREIGISQVAKHL